jgi:dTMP kinase
MADIKKGLFITFEGPEGAGKTTQLRMLKEYLESRGRECIITREPGGTPVAEQLREMVKHHNGEEPIFDETELLLFAASRAQHVRYLIKPAVERGAIILCDRFHDSTTAYQGYARGQDLETVERINRFAIGDCMPDITFLLDLPPEEGFKRTASREETMNVHDRLEAESLDFHLKVRDAFKTIAAKEPERFKIVNALDLPENIHSKIVEHLKDAV